MNQVPPKSDKESSDEAPASIPQTPPPSIGYGHPEFHFVQSIMEMQKSLGEINASISSLSKSVESIKSKVDDLVKWKNMILGGAIATGAILSIIFFILTKASEYITINIPSAQNHQELPTIASPPSEPPIQKKP
ncbi:MAG: hypothetical protein ABL884_02565 [Methyloglobulus sp.]